MNMYLTAHPSILPQPVQGPAELVEIRAFAWSADYSWLRHLTCRNHPTAKYYTKNWWDRQLHLVDYPTDMSPYTECPCPASDMVVVVAPGTHEASDMVAARLVAHKKLGCDKDQMVFEGTYGAPGIGQAWRCGYCNRAWSNIGGTFVAEEEGLHLLTDHDVR